MLQKDTRFQNSFLILFYFHFTLKCLNKWFLLQAVLKEALVKREMDKSSLFFLYGNKRISGYALAKKFAQEGNQVIATARRIEALEGLEG